MTLAPHALLDPVQPLSSETAFSLPVAARCALCYSRLRLVLDLGEQPLANALLAHRDDPYPRYPLRLGECVGCRHLQLPDTVPPEALFRTYAYRTGANEPACRHFQALAGVLAQNLEPGATVCDVGSNDGTLLGYLRAEGCSVYGVDPSDVAAEVPGTVGKFFCLRTAQELREDGRVPQAIVMANVLAHTPDPAGIVFAAAHLLDPGGLLIIEVPYFYDLYRLGAWDSVYHEHQHQFTAHALQRLLVPVGFAVEGLQRLPVHGGSLRVWARRVSNPQRAQVSASWLALLQGELEYPLDLEAFAARVDRHCLWLQEQCAGVKRLAGYGAPAKATVLLNRAGLQPEYCTDSTPQKQGRYVPGVGVPIVSPRELDVRPPDRVLLLAWNYAEVVQARHPELAGKWIVPFPAPL